MAPSPPNDAEPAGRLSLPRGAAARRALLVLALAVAAGVAYWALTARFLSWNSDVQPAPGATPIVIGGSPLLDRPAPDFSLTDSEGHPVRLADYRGRPVIVNFWASWCIPCREEFALFVDGRRAHAAEKLEILGIIYKDSTDAARAFMVAHGAEWPALVDPESSTATAYHVIGAPTTFYVDRAGIVRAISYGPPPVDAFNDQLGKILR